ncbi:MAG: MerR family DNA-binding transcriptional regulator [Defluviitaleaceae bacterium]|nr:MerR family DNA-binding transcriptional regulator [Defluviitaleaceae bacterium]
MIEKSKLLTIGDMSKMTGASAKSLRYYEKIGILRPAYIDPDSKYRYYTLDQTNIVGVIMFCIELDIPLAEFAKYIETDGTMDFRKTIQAGRKEVEKKMTALKKGLNLLDYLEQQIDLTELHKPGEIYMREMPEKIYYVHPCGQSITDVTELEASKAIAELSRMIEIHEMCEYGCLRESTPGGTMYYAFVEVPKDAQVENKRIIPSGTFICRQSEEYQVENTTEIFADYLKGKDSFIAIETDVITGRHKINKPFSELRILC